LRIGLISDTHGRLRPEVLTHFEGVQLILHAGDVGTLDVLTALEAVAPVHAVYGNTDGFALRDRLRAEVTLQLEGRTLVLVHGDVFGAPTPGKLHEVWPDADIIVFGHTHQPALESLGNTLIINPGAAGPARFNLKPSVAILQLGPGPPTARFVRLEG
jgi:putative phosphoesterase